MSDLLIHSVPDKDLEQIQAEAEARQQSLQDYMLEIIHERATGSRNRRKLAEIEERLKREGGRPISMEDIIAAKDAPRHGWEE
ncbi:hypothetical protein [Glycomyces tenuis]|uniref:hypothetical protein n=1 Tax=Glycomyces tenuis TaxID=58116 RepID=UPI0004161F0F|nr:hypothetical protein [Glycomyces tenuis]